MCDVLVAGPGETASGATLFAKNSDRQAGEVQPFVQLPAASHPPAATLRCTHVEIPQVGSTLAVMGHRPWWVWGFEQGVNEARVAIGNLTVFAREPVEEKPGLIGMDLVRLGLERGRSARAALDVITSLLERHGQGGPAIAPGGPGYQNAFVLADPAEAWLVETAGRHWAARRVRADAHSNHVALGSDWELASAGIEEHARASGLWRGDGRLDVAAAWRDPAIPGRISEGRLRRAREWIAATRGRADTDSFRAALRDHLAPGAGWPGGRTPEEEAYFTLCAHSAPIHETTASMVVALPARGAGGAPHGGAAGGDAGPAAGADPPAGADAPVGGAPWPVWISFATPCTGLFLPVYIDGVIPSALARGGPEREDDSAWWIWKDLQDAASADFTRHTPRLRVELDALEREIESERRAVEVRAAAARAQGDDDACGRLLQAFMARTTERAHERARALRAAL